jgi:hypothetical protein
MKTSFDDARLSIRLSTEIDATNSTNPLIWTTLMFVGYTYRETAPGVEDRGFTV